MYKSYRNIGIKSEVPILKVLRGYFQSNGFQWQTVSMLDLINLKMVSQSRLLNLPHILLPSLFPDYRD